MGVMICETGKPRRTNGSAIKPITINFRLRISERVKPQIHLPCRKQANANWDVLVHCNNKITAGDRGDNSHICSLCCSVHTGIRSSCTANINRFTRNMLDCLCDDSLYRGPFRLYLPPEKVSAVISDSEQQIAAWIGYRKAA